MWFFDFFMLISKYPGGEEEKSTHPLLKKKVKGFITKATLNKQLHTSNNKKKGNRDHQSTHPSKPWLNLRLRAHDTTLKPNTTHFTSFPLLRKHTRKMSRREAEELSVSECGSVGGRGRVRVKER